MDSRLPHDSQPRSRLRRLINRIEIDRATFFSLLLRVWQLLAGAVTVYFIAEHFSPELQGFYYTFASLMALQTFFELGLNIVIVNVASHEWAKLSLDESGAIRGDDRARSRLISLGRLIAGWYAIAAMLFAIGVGIGGYVFLAQQAAGIEWIGPWCAITVLSGGLLWLLPFNALLEGCGQNAIVNRFRLLQAVTASLGVWICISAGLELWAPVAAVAARVMWDVVLVAVRFRRFFRPFLAPTSTTARIEWTREIWPLQWRLAVQGCVGYFSYSLMTPVLFHYHGPAVAGQMGMTWAIVTAIQAAGLAWVQTRVPRFGVLIARRDFAELDRVFRRLTLVSLQILLVVSAGVWLAAVHSKDWFPEIAARFLSPSATAVLLAGVLLYHVPHCMSMYMRAHKRDPMLFTNVLSSMAIGACVFYGGREFAGLGAAIGYAVAVGMVVLPCMVFVWVGFRKTRS
ncbi:MAG: hypothetical protein O3A00_02440 [Planctomycetota bacterium]|nr:hypothetical protein [Planctomycetota bacterium]